MTAPGGAPPVVFGLAGLDRLVEVLIADGYRVIGPTVRDNAIVLDELDSAAGCPRAGVWIPGRAATGCADARMPRCSRTRPGRIMEAVPAPAAPAAVVGRPDGEFRPVPPASPRYAFLGVRGCDLAAIGILGQVLGGGRASRRRLRQSPAGAVRDRGELHRTGRGLLLRVDGHRPGAGPGYDLALTERIDAVRALVRGRGRQPRRAPASWPGCRTATRPAPRPESARADVSAAAQRMGRAMPPWTCRRCSRDTGSRRTGPRSPAAAWPAPTARWCARPAFAPRPRTSPI